MYIYVSINNIRGVKLMNVAIILAGGTGTRLGGDIPKQYIVVSGKPIITYCLEKFEKNAHIDSIVIVAAEEWRSFIRKNMKGISKFSRFAPAGSSRQQSILNGMNACDTDTSAVIIHDAARPNVSDRIISECILGLEKYDGVMPFLPVKDTIYYSETGVQISSLLNRDQLVAGQAPESLAGSHAEFRGKIFSIPGCWDFYLTSLYDDYMKLPPEEKRYYHIRKTYIDIR